MQTMNWIQFYESYLKIYQDSPDYRLGQHFVNLFIKDDSSLLLQGLWNKTGDEASTQIMHVIECFQWDMNKLPLVDKGE